MKHIELAQLLTQKFNTYNQPGFIKDDPICIPHRFSKKQDVEIAAFFAALLAWGNRTSIINSCTKLFNSMDNAPHHFILHFTQKDLWPLKKFVHRTFNSEDLFFLLYFLQHHYRKYQSLETAFSNWLHTTDEHVAPALNGFYNYVFEGYKEKMPRTQKHIATPAKKSACKRLNMFLRWMVRSDDKGVDFGLWKNILPAQLICPLDVHVARVARKLDLLKRKQNDWLAAVELTENLKKFDAADPVKFDFAIFGLGAIEKF